MDDVKIKVIDSNKLINAINKGSYDINLSVVMALGAAMLDTKGATMTLSDDDFGTLAICAIRYCYGRQTYMPGLVRDIIKPHLRNISDKDLGAMINDCDFQERMNLFGDERIDKPGWIAWRQALVEERERREKNVNADT